MEDLHPSIGGFAAEAIEAGSPGALADALKALVAKMSGDRFQPGMGEDSALGRGEALPDALLDLDEGQAKPFQVALGDGGEQVEQDEAAEPIRDGVGEGR